MNILPNYIINKIMVIPILIIGIDSRIVWKFTSSGGFLVKTVTWGNNNNRISPTPETKLLNSIGRLNVIARAWKLIRQALPTKINLENIVLLSIVVVLFVNEKNYRSHFRDVLDNKNHLVSHRASMPALIHLDLCFVEWLEQV